MNTAELEIRFPTSTVTGRVLVVDDHAHSRESMADILRHLGHDIDVCSSAMEALAAIDHDAYDVIITDLKMPGMNGLELLQALKQRRNDAQVIMVTAHATVATAVDAMRHGVLDYVEKPFSADQLEALVGRALRMGCSEQTAVPASADQPQPVTMIGNSPLLQALRERIAQVAPTDETVLITGESGTGKELVAHSIHAASRRRNKALVSLNCPALSAQLMESELFGHERGAFTSADTPRVGRFELADGGTILLDEVTEIELPLQAKLLRVLQERTFERVGSSSTQRTDVRVIATTNRDLSVEVEQGRFRQDLYYRLAVVPLLVPALRDRPEDIQPLAEYFLAGSAQRLGRASQQLNRPARDLLTHYHWPGNVRELENIMTRVSVLEQQATIRADHLQPWLIDAVGHTPSNTTENVTVGISLHEMERKLIEATLNHYGGHRSKTASALGIGVRTLSGRLREYGYAPRTKTFPKAA